MPTITAKRLMTRLEFILTHYLGPAKGTGSEPGVSYWFCPKCGHDTFHTLPHKPPLKDRAKCHNSACGFRGDDADMIKYFQPELTDYNDRLAVRWKLIQAWEKYKEAETA